MKFFVAAWLAALSLPAQDVIKRVVLPLDYDIPVRHLDSPRTFRAVGIIPQDSRAHFHALLRHSHDGVSWSEVTSVEVAHEGGTLFWIDGGARFLEIAAPAPMQVLLIEPGEVRPVARKAISSAVESQIVPRAGWGCGPECAPRTPPIFAPVTHLIVHHSAGVNQSTNWAAVVRSIWVLHVQSNGWNDIGYNFLVDPEGVIYEGRAGGEGVIGAHFSAVNTGTMGVCLIGTYSNQPPSASSRESLRRLLSWQAGKWKLDPSGQTLHRASNLTLNVISGHRDAALSPNSSGATECPGNALYSYLPEFRRQVSLDIPACRIELSRRNYCAPGSGASIEIDFNNPLNCEVAVELNADWLRAEGGRLIVSPNSSTARASEILIGGQVVGVSQAAAGVHGQPCPSRGAVVNAASFDTRPLGRGAIATVFGENLWSEGSTIRVLINNNISATVLGSTAQQVNFALPNNVNPGSARLFVERDGIRSAETMFWVTEAAPGIFVAQNYADTKVNTAENPVRPGEPLVVYGTGMGISSGLSWSLEWDGEPVPGLYLGPTPGFLGLAQANFIVPPRTSPGTHRFRLSVGGVPSQELTVHVAR